LVGTKHPNERQNPATNEKDSTARTKDVKLCELRAKELKLKKLEEQIKQREKSAQETNNNRTKLESRCQELETTNYELEQTVKTLIRRMGVLCLYRLSLYLFVLSATDRLTHFVYGGCIQH
jgi:septal ring factor EnvC (AmiA/AmiB activator)